MRAALPLALLTLSVAASAAEPAAEPARAQKIKLAVLDLVATGVPAELAANITAYVATEIDRMEVFKVVSGQDIRTMLSFEAQKQAMGCAGDSASCLAEIGGALGVRYLVSGGIGKIGDTMTINLTLTDIEKANVVGRSTEQVKEQSRMLETAGRAVKVLAAKILADRTATLLVTCPERGSTVKIDGQAVGVTPLQRRPITWGPHTLEVEKTGFVSYIEDFTVMTRGLVERQVSMVPSPDFLQGYEGKASKMRLGAWITTAAAVAAFGAAGYFQYDYNAKADDFKKKADLYNSKTELQTKPEWDKLKASYDETQSRYNWILGAAGLGLVCAAGSTFLWIAGDDPDRYARYRDVADNRDEGSWLPHLAFVPMPGGGFVSAGGTLP